MRIALFARQREPVAAILAEHLDGLGVPYMWISWSAIAQGMPAEFDGQNYIVDGYPLQKCRAYWLHQYPSESARVDRPGEEALPPTEWWTRTQLQKDRAHFAKSALRALDRAGAFGVNSYTETVESSWKPHQLQILRRAGLPLPPTLVSNVPERIMEFVAAHDEVVVKPIAGGAFAAEWNEHHRARLAEVREAPAIFQQRMRGKIVRVTVVGDEIVSAVEIPSTTLDYRADPAYLDGSIAYIPHPLRAEGRMFALEAARVCGHVVSGVDLIDSETGYILLEANGAPRYLDIERKTGAEISTRIARLLAVQSSAA